MFDEPEPMSKSPLGDFLVLLTISETAVLHLVPSQEPPSIELSLVWMLCYSLDQLCCPFWMFSRYIGALMVRTKRELNNFTSFLTDVAPKNTGSAMAVKRLA